MVLIGFITHLGSFQIFVVQVVVVVVEAGVDKLKLQTLGQPTLGHARTECRPSLVWPTPPATSHPVKWQGC